MCLPTLQWVWIKLCYCYHCSAHQLLIHFDVRYHDGCNDGVVMESVLTSASLFILIVPLVYFIVLRA